MYCGAQSHFRDGRTEAQKGAKTSSCLGICRRLLAPHSPNWSLPPLPQSPAGVRDTPPPAPLTMRTGLEGAAPQLLLPSPQVQLIDVRVDHVIYRHAACAHRAFSVLGDTRAVSADTSVPLGCHVQADRDPRVSLEHASRNTCSTYAARFLTALPPGPDLGTALLADHSHLPRPPRTLRRLWPWSWSRNLACP